MESKSQYEHEGEIISQYLISARAGQREKDLYADAMIKLDIRLSNCDQLLWKSMLRTKGRMACIDAGLAILEPGNNVRRKIFTMLAILEASPRYARFFLSKDYSSFYIFRLMLTGIRAVSRAFTGIIIIKVIKRNCS